MKLQLQKQFKWNYIALSFLLPFFALLVLRLVCSITFNGKYAMLYSDCYHSIFPSLRHSAKHCYPVNLCSSAGRWVWVWTIWALLPIIWHPR